MDISTKSWHYKIVKMSDNTPLSLCTYFWTFIRNLGILLLVLLVVGFFVFSFFNTIIVFFLYGIEFIPDSSKVAFGMVCIIAFCFLCAFLFIRTKESEWYQKRKMENIQKPPNILFSYLKAKKRKICPMINYKY